MVLIWVANPVTIANAQVSKSNRFNRGPGGFNSLIVTREENKLIPKAFSSDLINRKCSNELKNICVGYAELNHMLS